MAFVIKKKSGLIIPKTPTLILPGMKEKEESLTEKIIEEEIKNILSDTVGIKTRIKIRRLEFIPIYRKFRGEKEIGKIYLKQKYTHQTFVIDANDIESRGVTLLEFFDYIILAGATEIQDSNKALEIM